MGQHKIVLATQNKGKLKELQTLLGSLSITLVSQGELGIDTVEETATTFIENAFIKARHAAKKSNLPALADDSGLVVPSLQGQPGIYSSRFAGENASDPDNIQKLLRDMNNYSGEKRKAYFYCVLCLFKHHLDPTPLICQGYVDGFITSAPSGNSGFGYDPVMYYPPEKKTFAELSPKQKNAVSHRAMATRQLIRMLPEWLTRI